MKNGNERGFSLIELLLVVVIIGIVASIAVPALQKGVRAAENGNMIATLRTVSSSEVSFYSQNGRFGRLAEMNAAAGNLLGTSANGGLELDRGKFALTMLPSSPTDAQLKNGYTIVALRNVAGEGVIYEYRIIQTGEILQIQP